MPRPIAAVGASLFRVPLAEVLVDAKHGEHTHFELVTCTITLVDGRSVRAASPVEHDPRITSLSPPALYLRPQLR